jgi:nicotinamide mononucleotide transporter
MYTDAAFPYWDSLTTWSAMFATWLVARKVLENWYYWLIIDAVSVWLYVERGLMFIAGLYLVYLVMIVFGYVAWKRSMNDAALVTAGAEA